jgi:acylphosphatase
MRNMTKRVHLFVSGRVQGVYFRAHTHKKARALALAGWVRNLPDGRVEIVAEGGEENIASFLDWVRLGPPASRVEGIKLEWSEPQDEKGFRIRYS